MRWTTSTPSSILALAALDAVGPQAKAGQVGRDAGHVEGDGLQRGVAPWLVVGGEDAEVVAQYGVVVAEIDDAVVAREVAGHEDKFHIVLLAVGHVEVAHHADHLGRGLCRPASG